MQTKQVVELLKKHLSGDLTAEESVQLTEWIQASENNAALIEDLNDPDFLRTQLCRFESVDTDGNWERVMSLRKNATTVQDPPRISLFKKIWPYTAAAIVLLVSAVWLFSGDHSFFNNNKHFKTRLGEKLRFSLPDGSEVILNSGSRLLLSKTFNKTNREIQFEGEAYFDIAPKASLPFIIHTSAMKLSVLGTAFNIRAYPEEKAEVTSLIRGKVEIILPEEEENETGAAHRFILVPYQKLTLAKQPNSSKAEDQGKKSRTAVTPGIQIDSLKTSQLGGITEIAWMENKLVFDNEPLSAVAAKIEKWYGINTLIETPELEPILCTGSFETESLDKVLESMQFSIPMLKYKKVENNTVLILYK